MNSNVRPLTISQLANIALDNLWDESKELKSYLRMAEKLRKEGQQALDLKDYEASFVKFARAASLVMEYLPQHRDYTTLLNADQRNNLNLNGLDMMSRMAEIKPILIKKIADWDARPPEEVKTKPKGEVRFLPQKTYLPSEEDYWESMQKMNISGNKKGTELRKVAALDAAQKAAAAGDEERLRRQRQKEDEEREKMLRQQEEEHAKHLRRQEEMRQREEEIRKRREMQKREQEGIAKRQMEADGTRREILQTISANNPGVTVGSRPITPPPVRLPLENPAVYDGDTTDSDSPQKTRHPRIEYPTRPSRSGSIPPPVTTASLPPAQARIQYPQLMTQHQQHQGYMPFEGDARVSYPTNLLSRPSLTQTVPLHGIPQPQPASGPSQTYPSYPGPSRPAPPLPHPPQPQAQSRPLPQQQQQQTPPRLSKDGLRQVNVPRECLSRFVNIAMVNTSKNLETCGLLLGKDRGNKFAVTTLLIPKQHATSDTCAMDEEELVMQFTEERGLITLGWTHLD
ncbi:hypothetical protein H0H92_006419 [Tricholoma furcatifolium]|nr:hypothetical protein H0H92_006419 [Tricholoma furcatifolium]